MFMRLVLNEPVIFKEWLFWFPLAEFTYQYLEQFFGFEKGFFNK